MNRRRGAIWLLVIGISWVLCGCVTKQTETEHYVLTQNSVAQLSADAVSEPDDPPPMNLRVDCAPSEDEDGDPVCDKIEVDSEMPVVLWRPGWHPLQLSAFEFVFDDELVRDLDGQAIAHISDGDIFALQTSTTTRHRRSVRGRWFSAGLATMPVLWISLFVLLHSYWMEH